MIKHSDSQIFLKIQRLGFKWQLIIAPGEILPKSRMRSWQQYNIDKLNVYNFFKKEVYIKFSGFLSKSKQSDKFHRSTFPQIKYICCIFVRRKVWQKYCFLMQRKNDFVQFHHFMKVKPMGFCKLQTKKCEEISTKRLRQVNDVHSSSVYPQESEGKTETGRKSKVNIIATIAS